MSRKEEPYRTGKAGGLSWTYRAGMESLIEPDYARVRLAAPDENRVRVRGRYKIGGDTYFVKVFKKTGLARALKTALLGHVAKKEFRASRYLSSAGIQTPEAIAVGVSPRLDDRAVIIFREISGAVAARDLFLKAGPDERGKYLDLIAETTAALHRASFHHRDYHGGNLIVTGAETASPQIWVIDLHRSSFPRDMSGKRGANNIGDILHSLMPSMKQGDVARFLSRYRENYPTARWDDAEAVRIIKKRSVRIETRRLKSRAKRCTMNSSGFFVSRSRSQIMYGRRVISPDEITRIIGEFERGGGRVVKTDTKATIALIGTDRAEICVKAYERLGVFGRIKALLGFSRGHNSWRAAHNLFIRDFNTPLALGLLIKRRFYIPQAVYLVTESMAPRLEMDRFILRNLADAPPGERERFAASLGTVVGSLHRAGIYHRDLKTTNIAVGSQGDDYSFAFIDLDYVAFRRSVPATRRAKNLSQIFLSTPGLITAQARKIFFDAYIAASGSPEAKRTVARLVAGLVKGKSLMYVSDGGDVVEDARALYGQLWGDA